MTDKRVKQPGIGSGTAQKREAELRRLSRPTPPCSQCSAPVDMPNETAARFATWRKTGRAYCSDQCRAKWLSEASSARLSRTNRVHASARMTANNPMARASAREKMRATLAEIGHKPRIRGGNGMSTPEPQRVLAELLGWPMESIVAPGDGERPYHYKLDIAHPAMKVCVEVDGGSHYSLARQTSDRRRDERLARLGWLTFRFSNRDAMERTAECARTVMSTTSRWQARTPT
jgi:hypothetical protein